MAIHFIYISIEFQGVNITPSFNIITAIFSNKLRCNTRRGLLIKY